MRRTPCAGCSSPNPLGPARSSFNARSACLLYHSILSGKTLTLPLSLRRARNFFLTIIFTHPLSSYAQSLDGLWHNTTYSLIAAFRELIARTESTIPPQQPGRRVKPQTSGPQFELKKELMRFRQALSSEEAFYRGLLGRITAFYQLQGLAREHLVSVGIPVQDGMEGDQGLAPAMGIEEKREKLALVYKGLICLGDLERYKEQYSDRVRRERDGRERPGRDQDDYARAKMYYEVARGLVPDDGTCPRSWWSLHWWAYGDGWHRIRFQSARGDIDLHDR